MADTTKAHLSFKTMASKTTKETNIKQVQLAGSVALKILQHCSEAEVAGCGQLLGLDVSTVLEVTECFPFLPRSHDEYQLQKMRCLRDINIDTNVVGWYQSAPHGCYQTIELIDAFISYNDSIKKCVCIVCDVKHSQLGGIALKAIRLSKQFMDLYKANPNLTSRQLFENKITWRDIFVEVPIKVDNSPLIVALMAEIDSYGSVDALTANRLKLGTQPYLEKQLELVGEGMDALWGEVQDVSKWARMSARQEQQKQQWLIKRQAENLARKANGEEPLPEEDPVQFKPIEEPSLVNSYLHCNQLATLCENANSAACELLHKLQVAECLRQ